MLSVTVLALLLPGGPVHAESPPLKLTSIRQGTTSQVGVRETFPVAKNPVKFKTLWGMPFGDSTPRPPPPEVDFEHQMVVAAVLASNAGGCSSVNIDSVQVEDDLLVVHYRPRKRRSDEICVNAVVTAFHFVSVPVVDLPVVFREQERR
jgi:hypothetical protein